MHYDIFISFKATDGDVPTKDAEIANALYMQLAQEGYSVFFSKESICEIGKADFQRAIDEALDTAELLIVVSTKLNYINSRWVEYEWRQFNEDILSNVKPNGQIITYTADIDTREMPRVLRYVQNFAIDETEEMMKFIRAGLGGETEQRAKSAVGAPFEKDCPSGVLYSSSWQGEFERLKLESADSYSSDMVAIEKAKSLRRKAEYNVLVLGCAYGFVAESRFAYDDAAQHVVCVDYNREVIEKARELYGRFGHMYFYEVDVEAADYTEKVETIANELGIDGFDIIFSNDLIKYLNKPEVFLRRTRKLMHADALLIVRACDDESKAMYPDEGKLLEKVVKQSKQIVGMPDYSIGRKLPSMLMKNGMQLCHVMSDMRQNSMCSFDRKEEFFQRSFGNRRVIAQQRLLLATNQKEIARLEGLLADLDSFENAFYDAWYGEFDLICIARKEGLSHTEI